MTMAPLFLFLLALVQAAEPAAPSPERLPRVRMLAPEEGAIVIGPTRLRASVEPADAAASAVFSVDGREVCATTLPPFECEWNAGKAIVEHQVRLVVNLAGGGRVVRTARTRAGGFTETVDVDVVQVTVSVTDGRGHYIKGLPKASFHVSEDGRPQNLSHFYSEAVPLELVVAVDVSGSMEPAMPTLKRAVAEFLGAVPARDHVTLVGFNDEVFTLTQGETDPAARMKAVKGMTAWGSTALYDAIVHGVDMLGTQPGRKALVVFTDGEDRGSHVAVDEVERALQASDLTLYMIGQGRGVTNDALKQVMQRLSRPTGGRALFTDSINELHHAFDELLDELSNQYVLGYQPMNASRDGSWRTIGVTVDGQARVRARHGYRAVGR
jgi:Ca-activated chloride channel family protein